MKKIGLLLTAIICYNAALAQKYVPKISAGTALAYTISVNGESIQFQLNVNSISDSVKMTWEVSKYGKGTYVMAVKSLENGSKMILEAPEPDEVTRLSDSQTMAFISRSAFKSMAKNKEMEFDDIKYVLAQDATPAIKVDDKELDVLHAISTDGKNEMWILNYPDFPLICKSRNGTLGAAMTLRSIR